MYPLNNGLGSVTLNGDTLLSTAYRKDKGGTYGTPTTSAADSTTTKDHQLRVQKLFCCILNYIDTRSYVYMICMRDFQQDGIAVYEFISAWGPLPVPPRIIRAREDTWNYMTMDKLRIFASLDGIFRWAEAVTQQGIILGKKGDIMLEKFTSGFPSWFSVEVIQMNKDSDPDLLCPATWGDDPEFASAAHSALPHPMAGFPDLFKYSRKYFPEYAKKCAEQHKNTPSGMLLSCEPCDQEEMIHLVLDQVTPNMKCNYCGGSEHPTTLTLPDGSKAYCLKKIIDDMRRNKSSTHAKSLDITDATPDASIHLTEQIEELTNQVAQMQSELVNKLNERPRRPFNKQRRAVEARSATSENTESEAPDADENDDQESDDSAYSVANQSIFANALQPKRFQRRKQ